MASRLTYITVATAILAAFLLHAGCKQIADDRVNPFRNTTVTQVPTENPGQGNEVSPVAPGTQEAPIGPGYSVIATTSEIVLSTEEWGASTEEGSVSTEEGSASTEEESASTEETQIVKKELVYARVVISVYKEPNAASAPIEKVKVGAALLLMPETPATAEWLLVNTGNATGYVRQAEVCPNQFCIARKRNGVASVYARSKDIRVPQIQLAVNNIYPQSIRDLRISAQFYYHGERIGEDEAYVAAETLGILALKPGETRLVYLRPFFNLPNSEALSPENPVEVELHCALESFNYVPCGREKIDRMVY